MKRPLLFLVTLLITLPLLAQDINGFWKGTLTISRGCFPVNNIELQIRTLGDSLVGDSYHYLDINNYIKKNFRGHYNKAANKISIIEGIVTTYKIPNTCVVCIKNYEFRYSREGNKETLTGTWTGRIMETGVPCEPGTITLTRIKESAFKEVPEVKVDTGTLRLDFYDNAEIDGDSITVLVNKRVMLSHQKLGAKPITLFVTIDRQNTFQEVEMMAENLGSIPPNTALLIVTAGDKRYQLFLSSTEDKSARVRFVYDREGMLQNERAAKTLR